MNLAEICRNAPDSWTRRSPHLLAVLRDLSHELGLAFLQSTALPVSLSLSLSFARAEAGGLGLSFCGLEEGVSISPSRP